MSEDYRTRVAHARYRPETRLVHSGTLRSRIRRNIRGAVSHPGLCLRQRRTMRGAVQGRGPRLTSIRAIPIPTIAMFERRMIELEGAEAGRSTATGMAAVTTAMLAPLKAGDHVVAAKAMFGSCRYVVEDLLPRYGIQSTLVDGLDLDQWQQGDAAEYQKLLPGEPDQSDARRARYRRDRRDRASGRRAADRRQCVRDADLAEPAGARRRRRGVFRDQAYRRPGPLPRRNDPRRRKHSSPSTCTTSCARPGRRCRRSTPGCC